MRQTLTILALALAAGSVVSVAHAADKKDPEARFAKMDTNGDKKLSFEEFKGKREGDAAAKAEKAFKRLDKDNDKALSLEEFKAAGKKKDK